MPTPNEGESRSQYVGRCISYVMKHEGLGQDAAMGKCEGMYTQWLKNQRRAKNNTSLWNK